MKVKVPNWLWALLLIDFADISLLIGTRLGSWALPGWLEPVLPYVPELSSAAWLLWAYLPGGLWTQVEAGKKGQEKP